MMRRRWLIRFIGVAYTVLGIKLLIAGVVECPALVGLALIIVGADYFFKAK